MVPDRVYVGVENAPGALAVIVTTLPETVALKPCVVQGATAVAEQALMAFAILVAKVLVEVEAAAAQEIVSEPTVMLETEVLPEPLTVMVAVLPFG